MSTKNVYLYIFVIYFSLISNCLADSNLPYKEGELLVKFAPKANHAQKTKTEKNQFLASVNAGEVKHSFKRVPGLTVIKLPNGLSVQEALLKLKNKNEILYAEPDYIIYPDSTFPNDPYFNQQWALDNMGQTYGTPGASVDAPEAWDIIHDANNNIIIAVIDSGVDYTNPDLASNMWNGNAYHGYDFSTMGGKQRDLDPLDDVYHGTHVAGIIGARGNNGIGVAGVCWNTKIMAVKITNDHTEDSQVICN